MKLEYNLESLFEFIDGDRGKNYPSDNDFSDEGYCLFLNTGNVTKNGWNFNNNSFITESKDASLRKGRVELGDLIITTRGTVGNVVLYDERVPYKHVRINSGMLILRIKQLALLNKHFAYYLLISPYVGKTIALFRSGSAQPQLPIKDFKKIRAEIPDLSYQEKVASILSAYDNLIETNNKRIKLLEQMAENLYKEWFVRFRFPGHEKVKFVDGLPEGWNRYKISNFYNTTSGGTPSRSNSRYYENATIPWIKTGELQDSLIISTEENITEEAIKNSSAKKIPADTVLMAMYGVNIGKLAYTCIEATCNQACCVFRDKKDFSTKHYLFQYLKSIREYLLLISFGAAQQNLSQDLIKNVKIIMPSDEILKAFETAISPVFKEIKNLLLKNQNLIKQRDLLLPRLMSGKLQVH